MKRTISITIESITNEKIKKVQEARTAIRILSELAREMRHVAEEGSVDCLKASESTVKGERPTSALGYFHMTVDIDDLDEILHEISITTDLLEKQINELTQAIWMEIIK